MDKNEKNQEQQRMEEILCSIFRHDRKELNIMVTMLDMYKENKVAVVDLVDGELKPYEIRDYVDGLVV